MQFYVILILMCILGTANAGETKRIALSFDDIPRHAGAFYTPDERAIKLIAGLERAGVEQASFFVTTGNLSKSHGIGERTDEKVLDALFAERVLISDNGQ